MLAKNNLLANFFVGQHFFWLEEQVEYKRARNAIMVEQRRKSLEQNLINAREQDGHENSTTCMTKQSKDAAKQAFNMLIKKVEMLKR